MRIKYIRLICLLGLSLILLVAGCINTSSTSTSQSGAAENTVEEGKAQKSPVPGGVDKGAVEGSRSEDGTSRPVIDRIEVLMRSGLESENLVVYEPQRDIEPPKIEIKALYTAEISCVAGSLTGRPLDYYWTATGGKIFGSGKKITWLAPQAPIIYRITCRVSDGQSSTSATINISVRCCY